MRSMVSRANGERPTQVLHAEAKGAMSATSSEQRHHVHHVEELALARALGLAFESSGVRAHFFHGFNDSRPVPDGGFCRVSLV